MSQLASIGLFLAAVAAVFGAMLLWTRARTRERQEDVLMRLRAGDDAIIAASGFGEDQTISNPVLRWACHLVWRTGAETEPAMVARWMIAFALLVPIALVLMGVLAGLVAIGIVLVMTWAVLSRQAARQRARIIEQLPDFLESVARVLSAGNSLEEALISAAQESNEPLRGLFVSVGRQVRLGASVEGVLADMADIHRIRDLRVMAMAASINRKYGGSLREIFRSLVQAIRSRDMAARELRALTAETRFSAVVLAVIPVGLMLYILARNPEYYTTMWTDTGGRYMLIGSALLQAAGVFVIWRMLSRVQEGDA
ncbi:type II secretion system F family protein [Algiphilus sp.]|uniref:type II secretion system F family protein n=1 Tax=Algiphilus sp. TaxID=1872431 RepID=UPI001CA6D26F|nr:type II secretion system F family protein [Algiphilus sp.]MBY8965512.1 type II secretion system F family protein [Algiphilus acroporae]MCI5061835.1 type II secretion system F family protein [Algiphilus sp.]MCI5102429.1 type II secretion system F family protein [Algiphilus sp.]MCR9089913.1 type II secretion system F family protein [Pseudomonadota bacterium]